MAIPPDKPGVAADVPVAVVPQPPQGPPPFFLLPTSQLEALLQYLGTRPHDEVRQGYDGLCQLQPYWPPPAEEGVPGDEVPATEPTGPPA